MPRSSLGPRKTLTVRVPLELYEQLPGTSNDEIVAVLKRGLALPDLNEQDLSDLRLLSEMVGFASVEDMLRVFAAKEIFYAEQRRAEADQVASSNLIEEEPLEPPDEPAEKTDMSGFSEPPAPPFTADELAAEELPPPPRRNGTRPVVRVWQPPRPRPPRPPWERQGP